MHPNYVGIYALLASMPIWAIALILYFAFDVVMHIGRDRNEGLGYQVAYSAKIGDMGLMIAVLIGATILQRGDVVPPSWLMRPGWHIFLIASLFVLGWMVNDLTRHFRSAQKMDRYHDMVIAPFIVYCGITLVPIIVRGGTYTEKLVSLCLVVLWMLLVECDFMTHRMDQRAWLRDHLGLRLR